MFFLAIALLVVQYHVVDTITVQYSTAQSRLVIAAEADHATVGSHLRRYVVDLRV